MDFLIKYLDDTKIENILIIDNISYLNTSENCFNEIYNHIKNKNYIKIFVISKKIYKAENLILNPDKIKDTTFFFKNNIVFDVIIDFNNSDYIQQLSIFSLFYDKTIKYIIKINNTHQKETIYNIQKFSNNIILQNNYLFITK